MKKRRKIDDIYREKLTNAETTPPADVWQNIAAALPEKKKDRVIPLWFKLAGTAAALALLFSLFNISTPGTSEENSITSQWEYNITPDVDPVSSDFEEIMDDASKLLEKLVLTEEAQNIQKRRESSTGTNNSEITSDNLAQSTEGISEESEIADFPAGIIEDQPEIIPRSNPEAQLANNTATSQETEKEIAEPEKTDMTALADLQKETEKDIAADDLLDEISENAALVNRFSITTTAAAVYFDNMGSGNMLDQQFSNNEAGGEISMSYGVNLAYQISEKIKIRSGISKVDLNYSTQNLSSASVATASSFSDLENNVNPLSFTSGSLSQNLGFIEIPLEMEFALVKKKLEISLIGGASTFFLDKNRVSLESSSFSAHLGEAENLNNTSFSANLGLGLHYNLSSRFQLNMEPIFKYQINTFRNTQDINSYFFGIYSGLRYKF